MKRNKRILHMYFFRILAILFLLPLYSCAKADNSKYQEKNSIMHDIENIDSIVFKINELFNNKRSKEALNLITKYSEKFNLEQRVGVGTILYSNGYLELSKGYFEEASLHGDAEALYRLGYYYCYSRKEKNINLAIKYFKASIDAGYQSSYMNLGEIFLYEESFIDLSRAKFYFNKAINVGIMSGYYGLGEINLRGGHFKEAKDNFEKLKKNGYYLEYYDSYVNLHSKYRDSEYYDIDLAKKYVDLILLLIEDSRKYEILSDFYKDDHKYKDLSLSNYYASHSD